MNPVVWHGRPVHRILLATKTGDFCVHEGWRLYWSGVMGRHGGSLYRFILG